MVKKIIFNNHARPNLPTFQAVIISQEEGTVPTLPPLPTLPPTQPTSEPATPAPEIAASEPAAPTSLPDLDAISAPAPPLLSVENTAPQHESVVLSLGEGEEKEGVEEEYAGLLSYCYIL